MIFFLLAQQIQRIFFIIFHHIIKQVAMEKSDIILMYQGLKTSKELHDFWMVFSTANIKPALSVVSAICFFKHSSNFEMYDQFWAGRGCHISQHRTTVKKQHLNSARAGWPAGAAHCQPVGRRAGDKARWQQLCRTQRTDAASDQYTECLNSKDNEMKLGPLPTGRAGVPLQVRLARPPWGMLLVLADVSNCHFPNEP